MEVFGAGDEVGDVFCQYKRRAGDWLRILRILARCHCNGRALRIQIDVSAQGPSVAGGSNGAPGDFNVAVWRIDPIALRIGRCAGAGERTAGGGNGAAGDYSAIKAGAIDPITPCIGLCVGAGAGECTAGGFDGAPGDDNIVLQRIPAIDAAAPGVVAAGRDSAALGGDLTAGDGDNIGVDAAAGITAILFAGRDRAAGGFDGAAGDGDVACGVNAMALKLCRPAGGGDGAASDDGITPGVNAVAFPTAGLGGIAAGGGQAAAAGDGEGNLIINMDAIAAAISP